MTTWVSDTPPTTVWYGIGIRNLRTGSFEDGSGAFPDYWVNIGVGDWDWRTTGAHDGSKALGVERPASGDSTADAATTDGYSSEPATQYEVSFYYKRLANANLACVVRTGRGWTSGTLVATTTCAQSAVWTEKTFTFNGSAKPVYILFRAVVEAGSGYAVEIDKVVITASGSVTIWQSDTPPTTVWSES